MRKDKLSKTKQDDFTALRIIRNVNRIVSEYPEEAQRLKIQYAMICAVNGNDWAISFDFTGEDDQWYDACEEYKYSDKAGTLLGAAVLTHAKVHTAITKQLTSTTEMLAILNAEETDEK